MNQIEIASVALGTQPCDLYENELEVFEERAHLRILRGRRIDEKTRGYEKICRFASERSVGFSARVFRRKRDEQRRGLAEVATGLVAIRVDDGGGVRRYRLVRGGSRG